MKTNTINNSNFLKLFFIAIALTTFNGLRAQCLNNTCDNDVVMQTKSGNFILNSDKSSPSAYFSLWGSSGNVDLVNNSSSFEIKTPVSSNVIMTTGNVGIGITTPTQKLHVVGNVRAGYAMIGVKNDQSAIFGHTNFNPGSDGPQGYALMQGPGGATFLNSELNTPLALRNGNQDRLVIDGDTSTFTNTLRAGKQATIANGGTHYLGGATCLGTYSPVAGVTLTVDGRVYISDGGGTEKGFANFNAENFKDYLLWVEEGIVASDVAIATIAQWPDYVFNKDYKLNSLNEVAAFIKTNGHLPTMPSAKEVEEKGFTVADMTKRTVKTVEELTLHTIEQQKQIENQAQLIESLVIRLNALEGKK